MQKIKSMFIISGLALLLYTRLVGLGWGLPYAMHPDERNMVMAIQQLHCNLPSNILTTNYPSAQLRVNQQLTTCFNPHFYAYGQLPLYAGYGIVWIMKFFDGDLGTPVGFEEATLALRLISAVASVINVIVLMKIVALIVPQLRSKVKVQKSKINVKNQRFFNFNFSPSILPFAFCLFTFSPYFIQFSHFGTTESLLMLFYSLILLYSLQLVDTFKRSTLIYAAITCGLALATKVSSLSFITVPPAAIITAQYQVFLRLGIPLKIRGGGLPRRQKNLIQAAIAARQMVFYICIFLFVTIFTFVVFSPHNFLNWEEFISSMNYESAVGLGTYIPFYTRQFVGTIPVIFQMLKILPYALGWPVFVLGMLGFFGLSWKNKYLNVIRFAILVYFVPSSFFFAKWSRFMAPIFPLISVFAVLFLIRRIKVIKIIIIITVITIVPGIAYLSIYQVSDVRFKASDWIYSHIPSGSKILSETANVVDIPVPPPNYQLQTTNYLINNFNFYDLDQDPHLPQRLKAAVEEADYIFVPSRRIFANHPAKNYPILNAYYDGLRSGKLGFEKVAEFSSYPRIRLFGKTIFKLPDEQAEETWTVFDHPVIRVYKKVDGRWSRIGGQLPDVSHYKTITYRLTTNDYRLLVADTPEKWEKGLMYVRSKKDIGGADGMIFLFPETQLQTFWNKNTVSNLDVYWVNGDEAVGKSFLPSIEESKNIVTVSSPKEVNRVVELIKIKDQKAEVKN